MILDERLEFADAVSVVGTAGAAALLTNFDVIDLGVDGLDIANGEPIWLVITTDTEVITAGSAGTIVFSLVSDSTANLATSPTTHLSSPSLVTDDSAANSAALNAGGLIFAAQLPLGPYERYLGILTTIGTTDTTAGKVNAFLTKDVAKWTALPNAVGA